MGSSSAVIRDVLPSIAFDFQPTPILILSESHNVVLANKACEEHFGDSEQSIGKHVNDLPLIWQDGGTDAFRSLLAGHTNDISASGSQAGDVNHGTTLKLQVIMADHNSLSHTTAQLLVSRFPVLNERYTILSFENISINPGIPLAFRPGRKGQTLSSVPTRPSASVKKSDSYPGTIPSRSASQPYLEGKFSQLRDAIYFSQVTDRGGWLLSADGKFCFPNWKGANDVQAVEVDDLELFLQSWDVWDPDFTRKLPISEYPAIVLNRERRKYQTRYGLREGGKNIILAAEGEPLYDRETGEYLGGVVWLSSLGEYEDVVAADLKANLTDFRLFCERLPHMLWTVDENGLADYFSQSWYEFTGLTEAESMGLGFQAAIHCDDMAGIWAKFKESNSTKQTVVSEARYIGRDGQSRWMHVRAKPLLDTNGKPLKWYGSSSDVNDIVLARLAAEEKRDQMKEMLKHADIGLFEMGSDERISILEGQLTWLVDQAQTCTLASLDSIGQEGTTLLKRHLSAIMDGEQNSASFEAKIHSRTYKVRLLGSGDPFSDLVIDKRVLGCTMDITEQRVRAELEAENARLVAEASIETEKSKLKTAFLAHMSHEIRTPIAGIIGSADALIEICSNSEQRDGVSDIQISANNLLTIVNDILDLSKIEAGQLTFEKLTYEIDDIIAQVRRLFMHTARAKGLELTKSTSTDALKVTGDPCRVRQIISNLVSNSIKFTSKGSIDLAVHMENEKFVVIVEDTGQGIDAETLKLLFRPFVQGDASTARKYGGTGLGLTISRNLAQRMGGKLELRSTPSQGTAAILTLPKESNFSGAAEVVSSEAAPTPHKSLTRQPSPKTDTGSSRSTPPPVEESSEDRLDTLNFQTNATCSPPLVLIVEDNAINQKVAANLVRKLGYATKAVWNGQEALDYLEGQEGPHVNSNPKAMPQPRASHARPSLILMDCQMPLLDGYEATKIIRTDPRFANVRKTPVIALTASAILGDKEKCEAAGMDDYLVKPVKKTLLEATLQRWIPWSQTSGSPQSTSGDRYVIC